MSLQLKYSINQPAKTVFLYLTDMEKFASIHPIISKIDRLENNRYKVFETLKFWFFKFSFTYPVTVTSNQSKNCVVIKATVFKLTNIELSFDISTQKEYTEINEIVTIKTILPIKSIVYKIFEKQHQQLFENLEKVN
jgi:carbon monoxide dehydrogenase subunit G